MRPANTRWRGAEPGKGTSRWLRSRCTGRAGARTAGGPSGSWATSGSRSNGIDIEQDPDGVNVVQARNNGNNVIPTIIFPDGTFLSEPTNEQLAEKIGLERMAMMHVYDLIIIGGGPAGLTTSIYAARENLQTLVIDSKGLGGQAGVTERLDNYPGFPEGIGGAELAERIVQQARRYGVELLQAVSVALDHAATATRWTSRPPPATTTTRGPPSSPAAPRTAGRTRPARTT